MLCMTQLTEHERYRGIVQTMCEDRPEESSKVMKKGVDSTTSSVFYFLVQLIFFVPLGCAREDSRASPSLCVSG
jgi:hypothetical protein